MSFVSVIDHWNRLPIPLFHCSDHSDVFGRPTAKDGGISRVGKAEERGVFVSN